MREREGTCGAYPVIPRRQKVSDLQGAPNPVWAFKLLSGKRVWLYEAKFEDARVYGGVQIVGARVGARRTRRGQR